MECAKNTTTNCTEVGDLFLRNTSFLAYTCCLAVVMSSIGLFILLTCVSLSMATALPYSIRVYLSNLLMAGLVVVSISVFFLGSCIYLSVSDIPQDQLLLPICSVALWIFGTAAVARLWSLAAFSIAVYLIVRHGAQFRLVSAKRYVAPSIVGVWVSAVVINIHIVLPHVYAVQYAGGAACFPYYDAIPVVPRYAFTVSWMIFGGIIPLFVSFLMPAACFCYIKHNSVTQGAAYNKSMARFALFLVVGNLINISGQTIPGIVAFFAEGPGIYLTYGLITLSLLPTPLSIVLFLKPVRSEMKELVTKALRCKCRNKHRWGGSNQSTSALQSKVSTL